ncbi:hypothetical protein AB0L40_02250 [Patulibacter sp. NPDC049589]|uniref:hypothetical protein n=1 Tax=Patulibacter sp. NPDC049589 TaxID=3154731 RepID=UPI00343770A9
MRRHHERLRTGDRVDLPRHDAHGVVVEVLGRETVRVFRDGALEVHEVGRYCVLLGSGRTVVVNDGGGRIARAAAPPAREVESQ